MLYQAGLFVHLTAILVAGGGSIAAILAEMQLWRNLKWHPSHAKLFVPIIRSGARLVKVGVILFLISGIGMLYAVDWIYLRNYWFIAKLVCFLLLPLRGLFVGGPIVAQIAGLLEIKAHDSVELIRLRRRLRRYHNIQFALVAIILFLVVFRVQWLKWFDDLRF